MLSKHELNLLNFTIMNENNSKLNVKVGEVEISIEGPSDFVTKQYREMEEKLGIQERISGSKLAKSKAPKTTTRKSATTRTKKKAATKAKDTAQVGQVGEWMKSVPKKLKNTDKALIAAYLNQLASGDNTFKVRDVSNTIKAHDIKVSNPSNLMRNAEKARKLIEEVSRVGRQAHYRFTKQGVEYVRKKFPGLGDK